MNSNSDNIKIPEDFIQQLRLLNLQEVDLSTLEIYEKQRLLLEEAMRELSFGLGIILPVLLRDSTESWLRFCAEWDGKTIHGIRKLLGDFNSYFLEPDDEIILDD